MTEQQPFPTWQTPSPTRGRCFDFAFYAESRKFGVSLTTFSGRKGGYPNSSFSMSQPGISIASCEAPLWDAVFGLTNQIDDLAGQAAG